MVSPEMETLAEEFGAAVRSARASAGISLAEAARRSGFGAPTLLRYERNRIASLASVEQLVLGLGVAPGVAERLRAIAAIRANERPERRKERERCSACGAEIPPSRRGYCDNYCKGRAGRRGHAAKTPLAQFLERELKRRRVTASALGDEIGLSDSLMSNYLMKGRLPKAKQHQLLKDYFGDALPDFLNASDVAGERARPVLEANRHLAFTPAARKKWAQSRARNAAPKRPRLNPNAAQRLVDAGVERPQAIGELARLPEGRAALSLSRRLGRNPSPTQKELHAWADDYSARLGCTASDLLAVWRPMLRQRGIAWGGRPALRERFQFVTRLYESVEHTPAGKVPSGFWPEAAEMVAEMEGRVLLPQEQDGQLLRHWFREYRRRAAR